MKTFKTIEGHNTLIRATAVSASQFKLVQDIIKHNNGETKIRRKDLKAAHLALRDRKASPYFIAKNVAAQVKGEHGLYNLAVFKLRVEKAAKVVDPEMPKAPRKRTKKEKVSTEVAVAA